MAALVISAFPACGKSYYFNKHSKYAENATGTLKILDSDSSQFSWIYDENGNKTTERNPEFPKNYIDHIKDHLDSEDIIFVSTHESVRQGLCDAGIEFVLLYPENTGTNKELWKSRMIQRGNTEAFIEDQMKNWDDRLADLEDDLRGNWNFRIGEHIATSFEDVMNTMFGILKTSRESGVKIMTGKIVCDGRVKKYGVCYRV